MYRSFTHILNLKYLHILNLIMDPYEVEFLAENRTISIIPNFAHDKMYLISGEVGPFSAGLPTNVPLWLALNFKNRQKCRVVAPDWMNVDVLGDIKEQEKRSSVFTEMPHDHFMVEAKLILGTAQDDVQNSDQVKTLIKDIWDLRQAKLRMSMDKLMRSGGSYGRLNHLTTLEINSMKPLLPQALNILHTMKTVNDAISVTNLNSTIYSGNDTNTQ